MATAFIGIGTNEGNRPENLLAALKYIKDRAGEIVAESSVIETDPWGFDAPTRFLNEVVKITTLLKPGELLGVLLEIEKEMGRTRSGKGYRSRIIDLDILFYDDLVINNGELVIPHPLLHERLFVLKPMNEIAPGFVHPVLKKTIGELTLLASR